MVPALRLSSFRARKEELSESSIFEHAAVGERHGFRIRCCFWLDIWHLIFSSTVASRNRITDKGR